MLYYQYIIICIYFLNISIDLLLKYNLFHDTEQWNTQNISVQIEYNLYFVLVLLL